MKIEAEFFIEILSSGFSFQLSHKVQTCCRQRGSH